MGVPSYFYWLVSKFEEEILHGASTDSSKTKKEKSRKKTKNWKNKKGPKTGGGAAAAAAAAAVAEDEDNSDEFAKVEIDYLYLDLNCAIHPAVKKPGLTRAQMFPAVGEYLETIVSTADPQKLVYIAIDGVAPRAKMQQQRKRRFKNVQDKEMTNRIKKKHRMPIEDGEDFNMISPGTEFMEGLSEYLKKKIASWKAGPWKHLKVIFSDATIPGEGEHKIMDHIRDCTSDTDRIGVYGLDSDLIFLCLCNYRPNMFLLREKIHFGPKFRCAKEDSVEYVYMSIDNLRECLLKILNPYVSLRELENFKIFGSSEFDTYTKTDDVEASFMGHCQQMLEQKFYTTKKEEQNLIMDYIFMCFMLGNDFLPSAPSLKIKEGGLDQLLRVYKMVQMHQKSYLILDQCPARPAHVKGGVEKEGYFWINMTFFKDLLYQLTLLEDVMLQRQTQKRHYRINGFYKSRDYQAANDYEKEVLEFEYVENKGKDVIQLGHNGWKDRYYDHHFNIENRNFYEFRRNVQDICYNFFEGMMWTLAYYQNTCRNWDWCYDHHSAPAVSDLYESLKRINPNYITFPESHPATPLEQLMTILPPGSSQLLPKVLADLMENPQSPIIYFYPKSFELDILNNRYRWECHPLLPKIDPVRLKDTIRVNEKFLSPAQIKRNTSGTPLVF